MESNTVINNSVPVNNRDSSMVANKQPSIKKIFGGKWLAGLIGLVLILLVGGFLVKNFFFTQPALITIVGEGRVSAKPEMVKFTVNIATVGETAVEAIDKNRKLVNDVVTVLKGSGVEEKDIIVAYVRALPATGGGYQAVNSAEITLKDIGKFDNLVNSLYAVGVLNVGDIIFTTENSRDLEKEAVTLAIKEARGRVKEMSQAINKRAGRMVSIQTVEVGEAGALAGETAYRSSPGEQVSASPSQIEIVRQASIIFELK